MQNVEVSAKRIEPNRAQLSFACLSNLHAAAHNVISHNVYFNKETGKRMYLQSEIKTGVSSRRVHIEVSLRNTRMLIGDEPREDEREIKFLLRISREIYLKEMNPLRGTSVFDF